MRHTRTCVWLLLLLSALAPRLHAQCFTAPVSLQERAQHAASIALGQLASARAFDAPDGNIYTAYHVQVQAWISGELPENEVVVLGLGGVVGNRAQVTTPSLHLEPGLDYVLFLENPQVAITDPATPAGLRQCFAYADAQGALPGRNGWYHDRTSAEPLAETDLLNQIAAYTATTALTPAGQPYMARSGQPQTRAFGPLAGITAFTPQNTASGTIAAGDVLTITGSGFGSTAGTVSFKNADDGGSSTTTVSQASDIISWSSSTVKVKIPTKAGTGTFSVNGLTSPSPITIRYAHTAVNSDFSGFASATRQRYLLRNKNGSGGYTFVFNTAFAQNAAATAAIQRALETWKCETGMNWGASGTTSTTFAEDGENVILFDASLPAGILGRTTSRFSGSANSNCAQQNTVWWLNEVDMQYAPVPSSGKTWEFGPALPTSAEYDFESVAVHELGHALGLGHRIAPGEVMHFSISNGATIRTPAAVEFEGAVTKLNYSTSAPCFTPANSGSVHVLFNTANCLTAVAPTASDAAWSLMVRPSALALTPPDHAPYQYQLFDVQGHALTAVLHSDGGEALIPAAHLAAGLYICRVITSQSEVIALRVLIF